MSLLRAALPKHVHFVGICGRGTMGLASALARLSVRVTGSDENVFGSATEWLHKRGVQFRSGFSASALDPAPDMVVIARAYGRGNIEVETVLDRRLQYRSLPRFIADFFLDGTRNLIVAGSKGKTTTTAMATWIMQCAGLNPGYLIGGMARNFPETARFGELDLHVLEGDDYSSLWYDDNPKFCYYQPETAIVTNVLADHPEHHLGASGSTRHFGNLISQLPRSGLLVLGHDNEMTRQVRSAALCPSLRAGFDEDADIIIKDWIQTDSGIEFCIDDMAFSLPLFGRMNAINAALAAVAARHFGVKLSDAAAALREFRGVSNRMELLGSPSGITCYTDQGYLPECIAPTIEALRHRHSGRRFVFLFQPHVVDGLPQIITELVQALSCCDLILLADAYRPLHYKLFNPAYSDELFHHLTSQGVNTVSIGPVETAMPSAVPHLRQGDVVLGVIHPRQAQELHHLVQLLDLTPSCAS